MKIVDLGICKIGAPDDLNVLNTDGADIVMVASSLTDTLDLSGEVCKSEFCRRGCAASNKLNCPVMCGVTTVLGDVKHVSVFSFSRGRLADIADRTVNISGGDIAEGNAVKVLRCPKITLGLLIDTDVLLAGNWKKLAPYCDAICGVAYKCTEADLAYVPTYSSLFNMPYAVTYADGSLIYGKAE